MFSVAKFAAEGGGGWEKLKWEANWASGCETRVWARAWAWNSKTKLIATEVIPFRVVWRGKGKIFRVLFLCLLMREHFDTGVAKRRRI